MTMDGGLYTFFTVSRLVNASLCLLIYDHLITFADEVERIWKPKFTGATFLFLLNRYLVPIQTLICVAVFNSDAFATNVENCKLFVHFPAASGMVSTTIITVILMIRTYALYGANSPRLLAFLWSVLLFQAAAMATALGLSRVSVQPESHTCYLVGKSKLYVLFWLAPAVSDAVVFILTVRRANQLFKMNIRTTLIQTIYRDGIIYFTIVFALNLVNSCLYVFSTDFTRVMLAALSNNLSTVLVSRLQLNLRRVPLQYGTSEEMTSMHCISRDSLSRTLFSERFSRIFTETILVLGQEVDDIVESSEDWTEETLEIGTMEGLTKKITDP